MEAAAGYSPLGVATRARRARIGGNPANGRRTMTNSSEGGTITGTADKDYNLIWFA